ncbi:hypothetical protein PAAG_12057 [Paracoccidioides lutzii Pb01]|uniref:PARP catalytic domain-containing protein n=1 Tax=Paracoccidioides lutzii (strain ATCC MYA-826 / Pb01) TaxID=502779 RepID=A0A0A2V0G3_PARBA|nr:hypothetical protein PAAG_12057 [Paracoccidioides lutzii Pb01]KGQ01286.1 hypothetical protein PAAG_12057 [Paracoccidioides lutzii Pb01]
MLLLQTLPSVDENRDFLENASEKADPLLSDWRCKISKSALDVLRWIISSNRSCIIEDDNDSDRVSGMEAFMQLRFAQGAPDKEQRFVQAVVEASTIFAWHGSSFANWHDIVREGLHFKEIRHGRVFGNGVYMSSSFDIATYYARARFGSWPQSKLEISYAASMNEVVNAPKEFVSKSPHLVVARLDWLQPRYLFVKCKEPESAMGDDNDDDADDDKEEEEEEEADNPFPQFPLTEASDPIYHLQDPEYTARGQWGIPIKIPTTAVSQKILRDTPGEENEALDCLPTVDGYLSDTTAIKDAVMLSVEEQQDGYKNGKDPIRYTRDTPTIQRPTTTTTRTATTPDLTPPETDFVPGTLDSSTLPLLTKPQNATSWATKGLLRELKRDSRNPKDPTTTRTRLVRRPKHYKRHLSMDCGIALLRPVPPAIRGSQRSRSQNPWCLNSGSQTVTQSPAIFASSIESVLLQVRMAISSTDPQPARLERGQSIEDGTVRDYGIFEASAAFIRACRGHG